MMIDYNMVKESATGKWLSIFRALGISIREDGKHGTCPICNRKDKCRFDDKDGRGTWICSCDSGDGWKMVQEVLGVDFKEALVAVSEVIGGCESNPVPVEKPRITKEQMRKMFDHANRLQKDDVVDQYLAKRGLAIRPELSVWSSNGLWESETKREQKAMMAVYQMPDSTAVCVHRTYLTADADKLPIKSPKKISPALCMNISGGAVRLFPADGDVLGIAEGIETALAAAEDMNIPFWAATTANLLERWEPPTNVKHVVIVADHDRNFTGQAAAYRLANRVVLKFKKDAEVLIPLVPGSDWLDQLIKQKQMKGGR